MPARLRRVQRGAPSLTSRVQSPVSDGPPNRVGAGRIVAGATLALLVGSLAAYGALPTKPDEYPREVPFAGYEWVPVPLFAAALLALLGCRRRWGLSLAVTDLGAYLLWVLMGVLTGGN